jgi:hypothetical protein
LIVSSWVSVKLSPEAITPGLPGKRIVKRNRPSGESQRPAVGDASVESVIQEREAQPRQVTAYLMPKAPYNLEVKLSIDSQLILLEYFGTIRISPV